MMKKVEAYDTLIKNKSKSSEISKSNAAQQSNKTKNKSDAPRKVKYRNLFSDDDSPSASPSAERNPGNASNVSKLHRSQNHHLNVKT